MPSWPTLQNLLKPQQSAKSEQKARMGQLKQDKLMQQSHKSATKNTPQECLHCWTAQFKLQSLQYISFHIHNLHQKIVKISTIQSQSIPKYQRQTNHNNHLFLRVCIIRNVTKVLHLRWLNLFIFPIFKNNKNNIS